MEPKEKKTRSKRVDPKVKFGTTVLEETDVNIDLFKKQYPKGYKSSGQVVDMMAGLCLRINPKAAKEIHDFCLRRALEIERRLWRQHKSDVSELKADNLRDECDYLRKLADHMSRFYEDGDKRSAMKRLDLRDGSYLVIPEDWIVANEEDASTSSFAFVVEIAHSEIRGLPHIIILSPKESYSGCLDLGPALSFAAKASPVIRDALEKNADIVGVFPIRDASSYGRGNKAPYGAMIYRR